MFRIGAEDDARMGIVVGSNGDAKVSSRRISNELALPLRLALIETVASGGERRENKDENIKDTSNKGTDIMPMEINE